MTKYTYKRIKAGIENTIELKDETEKGIIEEFGNVKKGRKEGRKMNLVEIKEKMIVKYKTGCDANNGGLSFVKNSEWKGLLVGFFLNLTIGVNPKTLEIEKITS